MNQYNPENGTENVPEPVLPSHEDPLIRNPKTPGVATQGLRHGVLFSALGFGGGYGFGWITQPFGKKYKFNSIIVGTLTAIPAGILGIFTGRTSAQEAQGQYHYMRDKIDNCVAETNALRTELVECQQTHTAKHASAHTEHPHHLQSDTDSLTATPHTHVTAPAIAEEAVVEAAQATELS